MINGDANEFIDRIYSLQDTVFIYNGIKYWYQGYTPSKHKGIVHMEVIQYQPPGEGYVWEYNGPSFLEGLELFQTTAFFNGKTFWEVEQDIEWVDE